MSQEGKASQMTANKTSTRRNFLRTAASASTVFAAPMFIPGSALGMNGVVAPSERITMGAIGIGRRGTYDLGCFLGEADAQFVAVCDVKKSARKRAKNSIDQRNGNTDCETYRDLRELLGRDDIDAVLIATGPNWHATAATLAAKAGKDVYCEKPSTKNIQQSLDLAKVFRRTGRVFQAGTQRRNLPHFEFACELARTGKLGTLKTVYAHPAGMTAKTSGWAKPEPVPDKDDVDWDLYLGPAAYRPFNKKHLDGFNFEKGGGMVGGGVLEWGSHCVDLCQWANNADRTAPVEYFPPENRRVEATYANGVKLVIREDGWIPLGSCPVRFEGSDGWIETGDSGKFVISSPELLAGREVAEIGGYPATFHVRDFLNCVKSRGEPRADAETACYAHIACHAANIAVYLDRKLTYDTETHQFIDDPQANRLRSEALRAPWRI